MTEENPSPLSNLVAIYRERFSERALKQKNKVWRVICEDFLQRFIGPTDSVLDLGAGTCEFINNVRCGKKYAVDINPDTGKFAAEGVVVIRPETESSLALPDSSIDVVFASNFFEHLPSRQAIIDTLNEIRRVLVPCGKLIIVQPNVKYLYMEYWDYFDHQLALSEESMREAVVTCGFAIEILKGRFLPYTFRSRYPKSKVFVWTYLKLPILHRIFGKQMFIVARKH
ncbi:class I SAM-dependent methyltransferase [Candidatus Poribacteria bacterium]|nr:class I SAM-dependent methyltransferase [Candidatus Poribacteria bacterium]